MLVQRLRCLGGALFLCGFLAGLTTVVTAEELPESAMVRIENLYISGLLEQAELEGLRLLGTVEGVSDFDKAEVCRVLAFVYIAQEDQALGKQYFIQALQYNANLRLDRSLTSPKILAVFDEARSDFVRGRLVKRDVSESELRSYKLRLEGGVRSLVLPGWGQLHKGHKVRGIAWMSATGATAVGLAYSHLSMLDARDRYNSSKNANSAGENWDDYDKWWRVRNGFGYALAACWVSATIEALITEPPTNSSAGIDLGLFWNDINQQPMATLSVRF